MPEPTADHLRQIVEARCAVDALRDFAREHGMDFRQRDPLVIAIHQGLDVALQDAETIQLLQAALADQRAIGHGEGQEHAIADVNAGLVDDLIAPRLEEQAQTITRLQAEMDQLERDTKYAETYDLLKQVDLWREKYKTAQADLAARTAQLQQWQPIETAPKDTEMLLLIVPKSPGESYMDTSGNPIFSTFPPYIKMGRLGTWSALSKATHWMPLPDRPSVLASSASQEAT